MGTTSSKQPYQIVSSANTGPNKAVTINSSVSQEPVVNKQTVQSNFLQTAPQIQRQNAVSDIDTVGLDFTITRHAHSCNNLKEGKSDSNTQFLKSIPLAGKKIQGVVKNYNFFDRTSEHDPGLSFYGVLATLLKTSGILDNRYNSNTVFVSCLVRTWMTAILLYLPKIDNDTLTLVISPFLKEKHKDLGAIAKQMIVAALARKASTETNRETIRESNQGGYTTIDGGNLPKDIGEQIIMLIHFFKNLSVLYKHLKNKEEKEKETVEVSEVHITIYELLQKFVSKKIKLVIPINGHKHEIIIPLSQDISVDIDIELLSLNEGIFQSRVGQFYFFYTTLYPGFPRNSPSMSIVDVLKAYNSKFQSIMMEKSAQTLDNKRYNDFERNIAEYFESIISRELSRELVGGGDEKLTGTDTSTTSTVTDTEEDDDEDNEEDEANILSSTQTVPSIQTVPSTESKEEPIITTGVDETTKNFLTKDINQFLGWVKDYSSKNPTTGRDIHAVTHSDCMQTFCSQFRAELPKTANIGPNPVDYQLFEYNEITIPNQFPKLPNPSFSCRNFKRCNEQEKQSKILSENKKSNKKTFHLKEQNSWDLRFHANIHGSQSVLSNIKAYSGVKKPTIGNLRSACERNCNYGYGVGILVDENRTNECSKNLGINTISNEVPQQVPVPVPVSETVLKPVSVPASSVEINYNNESNDDIQANFEHAQTLPNYGFAQVPQAQLPQNNTKKWYQFWKAGNKTRKHQFNKKTKKQRKGKRNTQKINKKSNRK